MTKDPLYDRMRELAWRRKLSHSEEAELHQWLAAHPVEQADWELESSLNEAIERLPDAPLASNFTARVLKAVELQAVSNSGESFSNKLARLIRLRWLPRIAAASLVVGLGLITYKHHVRSHGLADSVVAVSDITSLPSPDILQDFDTIRALNQKPSADEQLLSALE